MFFSTLATGLLIFLCSFAFAYNVDHKIYAALAYNEDKSRKRGYWKEFRNKFKEKFILEDVNCPSEESLRRMISELRSNPASVNDNRKGRKLKKRSITASQAATIISKTNSDPEKGSRVLAAEVGLSYSSVLRVQKLNGIKFYKPFKSQQLTDQHMITRNYFCEYMVNRRDLTRRIAFSDECNFSLINMSYNSQQSRYRATNLYRIPDKWNEKFAKSQAKKWVQVFGVVQYGKPIHLQFLSEATVTGESYIKTIKKFLRDKKFGFNKRSIWMQDGAGCHRKRCVIDYLNETFGKNSIALGVETNFRQWPSKSPDLTVCDYWLWSHLKDGLRKLNSGWPKERSVMINKLRKIARDTPQDVINDAVLNFEKRVSKCEEFGGGIFERYL
jgi:hypothetical protein